MLHSMHAPSIIVETCLPRHRILLFKRNTQSQPCPGGVCLQASRSLLYKLTVCSLDSLGHTRFLKTTGVKRLSLGKDEVCVRSGHCGL